ncbi:hypothetical protein HDU76_000186, partial [Blyttiomyces sp. JEL0837]
MLKSTKSEAATNPVMTNATKTTPPSIIFKTEPVTSPAIQTFIKALNDEVQVMYPDWTTTVTVEQTSPGIGMFLAAYAQFDNVSTSTSASANDVDQFVTRIAERPVVQGPVDISLLRDSPVAEVKR